MQCLILIKKVFDNIDTHFYSVFKPDNLKEISYYIGLNSKEKKIYFYENQLFNNPLCIYSLQEDSFEKIDENLSKLISGRVIMKAISALKNNNFPQNISWEG